MVDIFLTKATRAGNQRGLFYWLHEDRKWDSISNFFRNIFPNFISFICSINFFFFFFFLENLWFKYKKFPKLQVYRFSLKLILIISEGETIQIFMNFNHNEYYAFSVGWFFIWIFFRNAHFNIACHVSIFDNT